MATTVQVMTLDDARLLKQLVVIDKTVDAAEGEGIEARWKFGRLLLERRVGKQLPKGLLREVAEATSKSTREISYRMQVADSYTDRAQLRNALQTYKSWFELTQSLSGNVHFSSESPDWNTPKEIIERVVKVFGKIDLDPCADPALTVPALRHFTKQNDGLVQAWAGRVYMNPPYGDGIQQWVEKLCAEPGVIEAIALVPARTDTAWFRLLRDYPVCFISGRLKFSQHDNSAPFPSAVFYRGADWHPFYDGFSDLGDIWTRWRKD